MRALPDTFIRSLAACALALCSLAALAQPPAGVPNDVRALPLERIRALTGNSVDWAYAHYSAGRGVGTATAECDTPVAVGESLFSCKIVVTAGAGRIAPGGKVSVMFPLGGTPPQVDRFWQPGYTFATSGFSWLPLSLNPTWLFRQERKFSGPNEITVATAMLPEGLAEGEQVVFRRFRANAGYLARGWDGERFRFRVYVDHDADGWEEEIAASPWLDKQPGQARSLMATVQSTAVVGEPVRLVVTAMDHYGNPATGFRGTLAFSHQGGSDGLPGAYRYSAEDRGAHTFEARFDRPGFYWVTVTDAAGRMSTESNPVEVLAAPPRYRLYWGDLHVHTELSADAWNSSPSVATYDGSYHIGRFRYGLDFMANTDHHGLITGNYDYADWQRMQRMTNAAYAPGEFVTLVAAEMSHGQGDQNVYVPGNSLPFYGKRTLKPQALWDALGPCEAITIPHHFAQSMRPWNWHNFNPQRMRLAEIFSSHGRAEYVGNQPHYSRHIKPTLAGQTWQDQLAAGRKLGAIAASDDHTASPGSSGLAGVWADALTREGIYTGLKQRRSYASTNGRNILEFTVNGEPMGSIISSDGAPVLHLRGATQTPIETIEIIKDNAVVYQHPSGGRVFDIQWQDPAFSGDAYYYVRVRTASRAGTVGLLAQQPEFAWSSPVWVSRRAAATAAEVDTVDTAGILSPLAEDATCQNPARKNTTTPS